MQNTLRRVSPETFKKALRDEDKAQIDTAVLVKDSLPEIDKEIILPGLNRVVQFTISTETVDRDGDIVSVKGWKNLDYFNAAGVVLWDHDASTPPIAQPLSTFVEDNKLKARCRFPTKDVYPFADTIYALIMDDVIKATSVGFRPLKWSEAQREGGSMGLSLNFEEQELLEFSVVSIPSNPDALVESKRKGIDLRPYVNWAERALDEKHSLFVPRESLEKAYMAAKGDSTTVSVPESIEKKGRVFSAKNLERLRSALDACVALQRELEALIEQGEDEPEVEPDEIVEVEEDSKQLSLFALKSALAEAFAEPQPPPQDPGEMLLSTLSEIVGNAVTAEVRRAKGQD